MPKYYVTVLGNNIVLNAKDPLDACVLASEAMAITTAGLQWKVSERGFANHPDDEVIYDSEIIREIKKRDRK